MQRATGIAILCRADFRILPVATWFIRWSAVLHRAEFHFGDAGVHAMHPAGLGFC